MDVARLRLMLSLAVPLWAISALLVWSAVTFVTRGSLLGLLIPRALRTATECAALIWLIRRTPTRREFTIVQYVAFVIPAACIAASALAYGGIVSPYAHAILSGLTLCWLSSPLPAARAPALGGVHHTLARQVLGQRLAGGLALLGRRDCGGGRQLGLGALQLFEP